ncbi:MAG: histidine phosphatase family protein, partial [Gemmatimonadota bacterium]
SYGKYEGRTTPEIRSEVPDWTIWQGKVPGGESAEQVAERTQRVIDRAEQASGDAIVFAHGHVLRVLAATYLGLPPEAGRLSVLGTAAMGVLGWEHEWHVIKRWNIQPPEEERG